MFFLKFKELGKLKREMFFFKMELYKQGMELKKIIEIKKLVLDVIF